MRGFDSESEAAVADNFKKGTTKLTQSLIDAVSATSSTQNIPAPLGRHYWASVLHVRCCGYGLSMHRLMTGTPANPKGKIYDFAPVAALVSVGSQCAGPER